MLGETLYTRDVNRRVYIQTPEGHRPDPRRYWRAHTVTGETRVCWILDDGAYKVDKKTFALRDIREFYGLDGHAYTQVQMEDVLWREAHGHKIIDAVRSADTATLREIAALVGYVEE